MREKVITEITFGTLLIEKTEILPKHRSKLDELLLALKAIYCNIEWREKIFTILDTHINGNKKKTGRPGMTLWSVFVIAQVRMCLNISYEDLHNLSNNHRTLRQIMGIERDYNFERIEFDYQQLYDNVTFLTEDILKEINEVIVSFGHKEVFKKKVKEALRLKTDSFVVESNVHFPTDYNLLWDSCRKSLDQISLLKKKYDNLPHWRKIKSWYASIKTLLRSVGHISARGGKNKDVLLKKTVKEYLTKVNQLLSKLESDKNNLPLNDLYDYNIHLDLESFMKLIEKHVDLVERRLLKGETIPHEEKLFSIFEQYTEWINKGKQHPNVELGKNVSITTDQTNLIVDWLIMENKTDSSVVVPLADRLLSKYKIQSWSWDKGYYSKENKELLLLEIENVCMPKKGKLSKIEAENEKNQTFRKLRNKHSGIESNINELEHRGLDRCPNRTYPHFKSYIAMAVCSYNLKKIGHELQQQARLKLINENQNRKLSA
jgi:hypothetical protein